MTFASFVEHYTEDLKTRLKENKDGRYITVTKEQVEAAKKQNKELNNKTSKLPQDNAVEKEDIPSYKASIEKKLKKYEKKKCGGEMKPKLAKRGEKVCPKCGKVHSAGVGCAVHNFKQAYKQGGQL